MKNYLSILFVFVTERLGRYLSGLHRLSCIIIFHQRIFFQPAMPPASKKSWKCSATKHQTDFVVIGYPNGLEPVWICNGHKPMGCWTRTNNGVVVLVKPTPKRKTVYIRRVWAWGCYTGSATKHRGNNESCIEARKLFWSAEYDINGDAHGKRRRSMRRVIKKGSRVFKH